MFLIRKAPERSVRRILSTPIETGRSAVTRLNLLTFACLRARCEGNIRSQSICSSTWSEAHFRLTWRGRDCCIAGRAFGTASSDLYSASMSLVDRLLRKSRERLIEADDEGFEAMLMLAKRCLSVCDL